MRQRRVGGSGLSVSELSLGCGIFGSRRESVGSVDDKLAGEMVSLAMDRGVNCFDTSHSYTDGESERILGLALRGRRTRAVISARIVGVGGPDPNDSGLSRVHIVREVEASLRRLRTDYIDLLQLQDWDQTVAPGQPLPSLAEPLRALDDLVRAGKIRYAGASDFRMWQFCEAVGLCDDSGWSPIISNQIHFSLVRRELELEMLPYCRYKGKGLLVWSPLAAGYLTGKYRRGKAAPKGARRSDPNIQFPHFDPARGEESVETLVRVAARRKATPAQVALAWSLRRPEISTLILGARTLEQLDSNLGAAEFELSDREAAELDASSRPAFFGELEQVEKPSGPSAANKEGSPI